MKKIVTFVILLCVFILAPTAVLISASQGAWIKYQGNPVLRPGESGSWDDRNVYSGFVRLDNGQFKMWYTGGGNTNSRSSIGYATSADGLTWTKSANNPILNPGKSFEWDGSGVSAPSVLYNADHQRWEMWYVGLSTVTGYKIGFATSPDGIVWTKYGGNPVVRTTVGGYDDQNVLSPSVLYKDGQYYMWYAGRGDRNQIFYATSADGANWTKYPGNPVVRLGGDYEWDNGEIAAPSVLLAGGRLEMWYQGYSRSTQQRYIGHATSADGIHWNKDGLNPVLGLEPGSWDQYSVHYPTVANANGTMMIWYHGEASYLGIQNLGVALWDKNAIPTPLPTFPGLPTEEPNETDEPDEPTPTPTLMADPYAVRINNGAMYATQISVTLQITTSTIAPKMMISNDSSFPGGQWSPFAATVRWTLNTDIPNTEPHIVFVRLGDAAGNIAAIVEDDILVDTSIPTGQILVMQATTEGGPNSLLLDAQDPDSGVGWMRIGNEPDLAGADWQPYAASIPWTFDARGIVYGQFRDRAGNVSAIFSADLAAAKAPTLYLPFSARP